MGTKYYMIIDGNGVPTGFYPSDVHTEIPKGAVEITKEQWEHALNSPGRIKWDGTDMVEFNPEELQPKDELKKKLLLRVKNKRKEIIKKGLQIKGTEGNTYQLKIDSQTKTNIDGYIALYEAGAKDKATDLVKWKFVNTWADVGYNAFIEIKGFIFDFIEKAFMAEDKHVKHIAAITGYDDYKKYDINTGFPDNLYTSTILK